MRPVLLLALLLGSGGEGEKVGYKVYGPYFEKNSSGLKGEESVLVLSEQKEFDRILGYGRTMKTKPELIPRDTFAKNLVLVVIKRGEKIYTYQIDKVNVVKGKLTLSYQAKGKESGGGARFSTPLVVVVPRAGVKEVEFVEGTRVVKTIRVEE